MSDNKYVLRDGVVLFEDKRGLILYDIYNRKKYLISNMKKNMFFIEEDRVVNDSIEGSIIEKLLCNHIIEHQRNEYNNDEIN